MESKYIQCVLVFVIYLGYFLETVHGRSILSAEEHERRRQEIITEEQNNMFGETIQLSDIEQIANEILMQGKREEYDLGFEDLAEFNAAFHFFLRKSQIEESEVFKFIKEMPKGAALHVHDTALIGGEFLLNITYRPNLYMCYINDDIHMKFMQSAMQDDTCQWKSMQEIRNNHENVSDFDKSLLKRFTIEVNDPFVENNDNYQSWIKLSKVFQTITPMLTYKPVWEDYFYEALRQYRDDNILYVEMRTTLPVLYDLEGNIYDEIDCAKSLKSVHDKFISDYNDSYGMRIIYAPQRSVENSVVQNYIDITKKLKSELGDFCVGFDLVGQEDLGRPLIDFIDELVEIPKEIDLFYHAGETNWYGTTTDYNLIDAALLGAKRLGHAYALNKHPIVSKILKENNAVIELNPISNQVLGYVSDMRNHPASALFAQNYKIIVSSDDPGLWGALPLSHDIYMAFMGIGSKTSDLKFLKQLAMNSLIYSAMPNDQKLDALVDFSAKWNKFLMNYIQSS